MSRSGSIADSLPTWVLAIVPLVVLGGVSGLLYLTSPFGNIESMADAGMLEIVWMLTIIGGIAGIAPVAIGMLWFPFIRSLDHRYLHAFFALSAGVLAFIAFEMSGEVFDHGAEVGSTTVGGVELAGTIVAGGLAVAGVGGTFAVMYAISEWRHRKMASAEKSGLTIAYLVAVALGLHSIGEGLAIGVAFIDGQGTLVMLLVVGFVMHNVMEGPTIVAAVAREHSVPPLRHFALMGVIAGGPVILGGWVGSLADSSVLAVLFYAVAVGAILQVLIELVDLIKFDAEAVVTRLNAATFVVGVALMFVLEDVIVEGWIVPG